MLRRLPSLFLPLLLLSACSPAGTPLPVPGTSAAIQNAHPPSNITPRQLPGIPSDTPIPAPADTPVPTLAWPTPIPPTFEIVPTASPQLSPVFSSAVIQILSPGPLSKVMTPIRLHGYIIPGAWNLIRVELYGEDDRLIFRSITRTYSEYKWAYFSMDIPFETRAAAELGRLQVSTNDEKGITTNLMAVHLLLQPEGYEEINPPGSLDERCQLINPPAGATVSNGILTVDGRFQSFNEEPIILELMTEEGVILASQWINVPAGGAGSVVPFSANLSYSVDNQVSARLVVRQFDDRIKGNMYLFSQPVILNP